MTNENVINKKKHISGLVFFFYLVLFIATSVVVGIIATNVRDKTNYKLEDVKIEVVDKRTKTKPSGFTHTEYFVYFDYEITNKTKAEIQTIDITTLVTDKNGNEIGTFTTTLLSFPTGETSDREIYFSTVSPEDDEIFTAFYNMNFDELNFEITVDYMRFVDGHTYRIETE